jgi:hypothetical protein
MKKKLLLVTLGLLAIPVYILGQDVTIHYDESVDFSQHKTYVWVEGTHVSDEITHQRIISAIENQLAMKGIRKVESGPDMQVDYHASVREEIDTYTVHPQPSWDIYDVQVHEYEVGTIIVDLQDTETRRLLWRGIVSRTVSSKPEKDRGRISKGIEKLFKEYPPD